MMRTKALLLAWQIIFGFLTSCNQKSGGDSTPDPETPPSPNAFEDLSRRLSQCEVEQYRSFPEGLVAIYGEVDGKYQLLCSGFAISAQTVITSPTCRNTSITAWAIVDLKFGQMLTPQSVSEWNDDHFEMGNGYLLKMGTYISSLSVDAPIAGWRQPIVTSIEQESIHRVSMRRLYPKTVGLVAAEDNCPKGVVAEATIFGPVSSLEFDEEGALLPPSEVHAYADNNVVCPAVPGLILASYPEGEATGVIGLGERNFTYYAQTCEESDGMIYSLASQIGGKF